MSILEFFTGEIRNICQHLHGKKNISASPFVVVKNCEMREC